MNKSKIFWTLAAVAMTGVVIHSLLVHEHDDSLTCRIFHSGGFAFVTGLVVARTVFFYTDD